MSDVKLKGAFPKTEANGLAGEEWRKRLAKDGVTPRVAIVVFNAPSGTYEAAGALTLPKVEVMAFEPIDDSDEATKLTDRLQELAAERTGQTELDVFGGDAA